MRISKRRLLVALLTCAAFLWIVPGAYASGWCGSGESTADLPDAVTGQQVHEIYALPSDGVDQFATIANQLADDTDAINAWWVQQDPTRHPRFDLAVFPACTALDISRVQLSFSSTQHAGDVKGAFDDVVGELTADGFANPFKRYLVYYDGPAPQSGVCGVGDGSFSSGPGYAVVWLQGCDGVPSDTVATHELLHALGAVPPGDPNACPGDSAHPCDSPTDVLYPTTAGQPLDQLVLDFNHDDYYGHSGSWPDIQDSPVLQLLGVAQVPLTVDFSGSGQVVADLPGLDCQASCTTQWDSGSHVSLSAEPASTTRFVGWQGACSGPGSCDLDLAQVRPSWRASAR